MKHTIFVASALACCLAGAVTAAERPAGTGEVPPPSPALALELVRKLDAVRLPTSSFVVDVKGSEQRDQEPAREFSFRLYARRPALPAGAFFSLIVMQTPAADRNKLILMKEAKVWFQEPRARNPTVLSAKLLWQQSFAADTLTARFEQQYEAALAGRETIDTLEDGRKTCAVIDLKPAGKRVTTAETLRYWLTDDGCPYQAVYFAASGRMLRTCRFGGYARVLGASRPTRCVVDDGKGSASFRFLDYRATELPESIFEPANLPRLRIAHEP